MTKCSTFADFYIDTMCMKLMTFYRNSKSISRRMFTTDPNLKISNNLKSEDKYIFLIMQISILKLIKSQEKWVLRFSDLYCYIFCFRLVDGLNLVGHFFSVIALQVKLAFSMYIVHRKCNVIC